MVFVLVDDLLPIMLELAGGVVKKVIDHPTGHDVR